MKPEGSERCPRCRSKEIGGQETKIMWQCGSSYTTKNGNFVQSSNCKRWMLKQKIAKLEERVKELSRELDIEKGDAEWLWNDEVIDESRSNKNNKVFF